jgi:hypothetical protein
MQQFGEYTPDIAALENPGLITAKNVMPGVKSYEPFASPVAYTSNGTDARPQGGFGIGRANGGNAYTVIGDAAKLYNLVSGAWSDISILGGYTTSADDIWEYTVFDTQLLATNYTDSIQTYTMGASTLFANLGGTPPRARHIATVRDFVVVGNTVDGVDGAQPSRVRWCGIGDPASWAISSATQADFQNLNGVGGWVQRIVGGEYGIIFQEQAITRMTYIGSPLIFQFDEVESGKGTPSPGSVVKVGSWVAYLGLDGFYIFDGQQSIPIGAGRVDKTFWADVDANYLGRITSSVDPVLQIIYWCYAASGNTNGRSNKILMYNYAPNATKRWAFAEVESHCIGITLGEGYTLDSLDAVSTNLDALPYSLDSKIWTGNTKNLSIIDSNLKLANLTGAPLSARLETGEIMLAQAKKSQVNLVRPYIDGTSAVVTATVGTRDAMDGAVTYTSPITLNSNGEAPFRAAARYHRFRVDITGGFDEAQGYDIESAEVLGSR